jgi:hypothetical protein
MVFELNGHGATRLFSIIGQSSSLAAEGPEGEPI